MVLTWRAVLGSIFEQRNSQLAWMGLVTMLFFVVWMYQVQLLVALFLGTRSFATLHAFLVALTTTLEGLVFLFLGNAIGALLSIALFSITFVSFPLLLDRDLDFVTAMITSVRAAITSPSRGNWLGDQHRRTADPRILAVFPWPCGGAADTWPHNLAPLP